MFVVKDCRGALCDVLVNRVELSTFRWTANLDGSWARNRVPHIRAIFAAR